MSLDVSDKNRSGFFFTWKIRNFQVCPLKGNEHLASPQFTSELTSEAKWTLEMYSCFKKGMFLCLRCDASSLQIPIQFNLFIKKKDDSKVEQTFSGVKDVGNINIYVGEIRQFVFEKADLFLPDDTLTVGCCFKVESDSTSNLEHLFAYTEMSQEKYSLTFPLSLQSSKSPMQQLLTFPLISVSKKYPNFKIILTSPSHHHDVRSLTTQIQMAKSSFRVFAKCKLSLQDADGVVKYLVDEERWFEADRNDETLELKNTIHKLETFFQNKNSEFTLHCKLTVTDGTYSTKMESYLHSPHDELPMQNLPDLPKKNEFKEKLRCLYSDGRLCDFSIHVDDKEFPVHKTVLGAASSVFCAMFEQEMKEKKCSMLTIEDIDSDTVQKLIDYAYTEIVGDLQWDSAVKLFAAADKYEILDLKQICAELLVSKLTAENVTDALMVADLHQDSFLKKAAETFVYSNFSEVFESEKWNVFMENHTKLANNLMLGILIKLGKNRLQ